ncbi:MAG: sigma-70 family RNA polymerase sigma factor [Solirubrobacteraceae bacterium]|nr:sigma-70 family RNA polymerase sigma factor [Solirubrobacteraceae bacterium]
MAATASSALEQIAGREAQLARALHAQFRRRLTADDTRDAVADAIATAHMARDELGELDVDRLEAWVRTRAYRNAIDQIRAIDGYGAQRRKASVSVDDYAETLADDDGDVLAGLDDELAERLTDGTAAQSVALALDRLTPDERRLLRLRHYDGLDVKTIAALLDIHPKKYERLHTRAIGKLRTIFIETTAGEHCEPVRALISRSRQVSLTPALSAEVAAHVEACAQCHAFEKRSLRLIAALPLPAPALADRLWTRMQDVLPGLGSHGDAVAAGATGTVAAAGGAGGAASTGILAGAGAKTLAAICGGAVTATCVGAIAVPVVKNARDKPERSTTETVPGPSRNAARQPVVVPAGTDRSGSRATRPASPAAGSKPAAKPRAAGSQVTGSLSLEDFGTPTGGASSASSPAPPPPPPPPPSSTFSQEFTP